MDRRLHTEAIQRAYPHYAHLPYAAKSVRSRDRAATRRLALALIEIAAHADEGLIRPGAGLPALLATALDGNASRLWQAPLMIYLDQVDQFCARAR
jgi:hypothetical protein